MTRIMKPNKKLIQTLTVVLLLAIQPFGAKFNGEFF